MLENIKQNNLKVLQIRSVNKRATMFLGKDEEYNPVLEWEGIDLDATLAVYNGFKGFDHIGAPVPKMLNIVKSMLANGVKVKIFTARADNPEAIPYIKAWLRLVGLPELDVTNVKDRYCVRIWDDKAIQIEPNTGKILSTNKIVLGK